jgi:glutathione peroxidase
VLEILAFPCRQFFNQELAFEADIKKEVDVKYKAAFPLFSKIEVNGESTHPVYKYLRYNSVCKTSKGVKLVPWNFTKFLVDRDGVVIKYYNPNVKPLDIAKDIGEFI